MIEINEIYDLIAVRIIVKTMSPVSSISFFISILFYTELVWHFVCEPLVESEDEKLNSCHLQILFKNRRIFFIAFYSELFSK